MALNLNETATLTLQLNNGEVGKSIDQLNDKAKELRKTINAIEKEGGKGSENWQNYKNELKDVLTATAQLKKEVDVTTMTYGQLDNHVKQLARDLKTLKPGTIEFTEAAAKLDTARKYLDEVSKSAKGAAVDLTKMADSDLKFGELKTKIEQLRTKLQGLSPASKEFIQTTKELQTTEKYYNDVKDSVEDTTKALHKQILEAKNTDLTYGQLETKVKLLNEQLKKLKPGTEEFITATKHLAEAEKHFEDVSDDVDKVKKGGEDLGQPTLWQKVGGGVGVMATAFRAFMALQIVGFIIDIGKSIFETTAKFEKYGKVLETAFMGNTKMAKETMAALKQLGAQTAFSVDELTEGYVKMVNRGLRPTKTEMIALTDLAASQGKTFDQLVEGLLDAATGEFERLKEFGTRASKAGEEVSFKFKDAQLVIKNTGSGFDVLDKVTGKVVNTFKNQEDATLGVMTALGSMQGVGGQNAKMMETLNGKSSNLGDSMDALKVAVGERLRPVFVWLLGVMATGVDWLLKISESTEPVVTVFGDLFDAIGTLISSFMPMIQRIFPNMISGGTALNGIMKLVALAFRAVLTPVQAGIAIFIAMGQTFGGVLQAARALESFLKGDIVGGKAQWDAAKNTFDQVGATAKANFAAIGNGWKQALVDKPKAVQVEAVFAAKETEQKRQAAMTDEQKKALDKQAKEAEKARKHEEKEHEKALADREKANAKALEDLAKLEAEAHIAGIKDEMQREFVKLMAKRDLEAEEILRGIQDEKLKNQQIAALDKKLQEDIERVAGEFAEKARKKAEEDEKKRLEMKKGILEQERLAENALFEWRLLVNKDKAGEILKIHKERADKQYQITLDKLKAEEEAERAKATREATNEEQKGQALKAIDDRYRAEEKLAEAKHAADLVQIEKEAKEKRQELRDNVSGAFKALLNLDSASFVDFGMKLIKTDADTWKNILKDRDAAMKMGAEMAQQAAQFLANLAKKRAEQEIAEAQRVRDENIRLLNDRIAAEKAAQDVAEAEKQRVTQDSNDKIQAIKSATEQTISSLEQQYRQLSTVDEKKKVAEQLQSYKDSADEKAQAAKDTAEENIAAAQLESKESIKAAQDTERATIKSVTNEKDQRIDAAEIARDAEIAAINKRKDVDQETRKTLLQEAKDKFEQEKKMATDEAQLKIDKAKDEAKTKIELAKDTAKTKTELANDQKDAELKAIKAVQDGDDKAAKEILERSKEDAREKIQLAKDEAEKKLDEAEREKKEKLKLVEAEKQARIQNQKELNRQIEEENKRAATIEREAKQKAWKAQQNADVASAVIAGALATVKALASGFFPLNLAFAATTAVMTGIQVAMIRKQPMPSFERGGFIARGGRHGSSYGRGGIALVDRQSQQEVGEMEGDEAIISKEQTAANLPLINRMFANARTPGRRSQSVLDMRGPAFREGGLLDAGRWSGRMFRYGGTVRRRYDEGGMVENNGEGPLSGVEQANQAHSQAIEQGKQQLSKMDALADAITAMDNNIQKSNKALASNMSSSLDNLNQSLTNELAGLSQTTKNSLDSLAENTKAGLDSMAGQVGGLKGSVNAVEGAVRENVGATRGVEGAVWATNQAGRLDALIGAISSFGGKG